MEDNDNESQFRLSSKSKTKKFKKKVKKVKKTLQELVDNEPDIDF